MPGSRRVPIILAICLLAAVPPSAASDTFAVTGAEIHTGTGEVVQGGTILVRDGKIAAVGRSVDVPAGAEVVDASGRVIIPGLIDNHIHIGADLENLNEFPNAFEPEIRMLDALVEGHESWTRALRAGMTTVATGTGSGEIMSGDWVVIKTFGPSLETRILREHGGIKFALDEADGVPTPKTDPAVFAATRAKLIKTSEYLAAWRRWEEGGREGAPPPRDLGLEALGRALTGDEEIRAHLHTPNQIRGAISLAEEFGVELQLHHVTDGYLVIDEIEAHHMPVVGLPLFTKFAFSERILEGPARFAEAGVTFAFHTDDPAGSAKWFRHTAGLAMRYGMDETAALEGLTSTAAKLVHLADRLGSIEAGKDADFVVLDGPWYEMRTRTEQVYVDGVLAYDRRRDEEPPPEAEPAGEVSWTDPLDPAKWSALPERTFSTPAIAIRGATIHTMVDAPIADGVVVMENGRITAVGPAQGVAIPRGARVIEAGGKHVMPGVVDAATHYGIASADLSEVASPFNADRRVVFAYAPEMEGGEPKTGGIRASELLAGGVTTQYVRVGGQTVIDGQGMIVKTAGRDLESVTLREPAGMSINVTTRPTRTFKQKQQAPATLPGLIAMLRDTLVKAGEYSARAAAASDESPAPRDLGMEALAAMLDGRMPARIEATAPSHIRSALAVAEEFDLPLIIEGGTGASAMRYELAGRGVPVILGPTSAPFPTGGEIASPEDYPIIDERTAALLAEAGVPFAIASYSEALGDLTEPLGGKFLLVEAAVAAGYGLSDDEALRAITLYPARILGIADRVGSLEPGKDADLVILPGPPLDTMSRVEQVFVDGTPVYELESEN